MLIYFAVASSFFPQSIDPQVLLNQVRHDVSQTVRSAPRYTCTETIERAWYHKEKTERPGCETDRAPQIGAGTLVETDRLRLDVAVAGEQEIFSWHGEAAFKTDKIDSLVTAGPIHSGSFFAFLSSIFLEGTAQIDYIGARNEDKHEVAVFRYTVPKSQSKFETETAEGQSAMGYHGEFTADPATHSLLKLTVVAEDTDVPDSARFCSLHLDTHYQTANINGKDFRLPAGVELTVLDHNREIKRTLTQYQGCHQFLAESRLSFDDAPAAATPSTPLVLKELPPGLQIAIRITSDTNPTKSWGGDSVTGQLAANLIDEQGRLLAPKGAPVRGHLLLMEALLKPQSYYIATVAFDQVAGYNLHLIAITEPVAASSAVMLSRVQLDNPPIGSDPSVCRFRLNEKGATLKGAVTHWVTQKP